MIKWEEYIIQLMTESDSVDGVSISFDEGKTETSISPIVKVSVLMLDKMIEKQGNKQMLIFPERQQTALSLALVKVIRNIFMGKSGVEYNPKAFCPQDKLKLGNAVVEFLRIENERIFLHMADLDEYSVPISMLPMLQKTDTKRPLSKSKKFCVERKKTQDKYKEGRLIVEHLNILSEYKTHMESSVCYVSSIKSVKAQLSLMQLCGDRVSDLLFISQADYEGKVKNIGAGQLKGTPAIILASDLYVANSLIEKGKPILSIIVDMASTDAIASQLDVLDKLLGKGLPIVFITDIVNSFKLNMFADRGFNIWRWHKENLTPGLYDVAPTIADKKIGHCVRKEVQYINVEGNEISESANLLLKYRKEIQGKSVSMMKLYEKLNYILFGISRETVPIEKVSNVLTYDALDKCDNILTNEKMYISDQMFTDHKLVIQNYKKIYAKGYTLNKYIALCRVLENNKNKKIAILIPEMTDKKRVESFWKNWAARRMLRINISVYSPTEYYNSENVDLDITIIVGWLKCAIMRKIFYSCNTEVYVVLLYDHENKWKNYAVKKWDIEQRYSDNKKIIQQSLSDQESMVLGVPYESETLSDIDDTDGEDELEEINLVLRENKYKQFSHGDFRKSGEMVEAIPINFVGGLLSFYQKSHKLVTASKIVAGYADKVEIVLPEELHIGDFVVVRESGKDVVKDIAEILLKNANMDNQRKLATMWRDAIKQELIYNTEEELARKIYMAGCDKEIVTIKNWIDDEDMIAPKAKKDLQYIADATDNKELKEMLDDVYEAVNKVRGAHIQAGRILSQQLKSKLANVLRKYGNIEPNNFWEPIEIEVENIGIVKVLKVIDIGHAIPIDASNTNRLIEESKI